MAPGHVRRADGRRRRRVGGDGPGVLHARPRRDRGRGRRHRASGGSRGGRGHGQDGRGAVEFTARRRKPGPGPIRAGTSPRGRRSIRSAAVGTGHAASVKRARIRVVGVTPARTAAARTAAVRTAARTSSSSRKSRCTLGSAGSGGSELGSTGAAGSAAALTSLTSFAKPQAASSAGCRHLQGYGRPECSCRLLARASTARAVVRGPPPARQRSPGQRMSLGQRIMRGTGGRREGTAQAVDSSWGHAIPGDIWGTSPPQWIATPGERTGPALGSHRRPRPRTGQLARLAPSCR